MEVIDRVAKLAGQRIAPGSIETVVPPLSLSDWRLSSDAGRPRRNAAARQHRPLRARRRAHVRQLPFDLRCNGGDVRREPWTCQKLTVDEACVVDGEEQSTKAARLHDLD